MKIAVLDSATLGDGVDMSVLEQFGKTKIYDMTPPEKVEERISEFDVVIINKVRLDGNNLKNALNLKLICVFATGYDNVDINYCRERGIAVCNVVGYSTHSVAQLTVTMALTLVTRIGEFTRYVENGGYSAGGIQNYLEPVFHEIDKMTWGIIGFGNIGKQVARVAEAMGCEVIINKRTPTDEYECVSVDEVCKRADIISVHTPLTGQTRNLINRERIALMKKTAVLINVARGAVTDEEAIAEAILGRRIGGFAADVYSVEPFPKEHPFTKIMGFDNVCLTPHMGWGAYEARVRCLNETVKNINAFIKGEKRNRVDL
ncbi:MAG: NAD(P)-dependent oxidoreductase [Bacillota bacterium]|nr:NAD(P)-dependent oxidoreductase [Bacillota bacterium]